jgi:hypothetical protein
MKCLAVPPGCAAVPAGGQRGWACLAAPSWATPARRKGAARPSGTATAAVAARDP